VVLQELAAAFTIISYGLCA